jgi:hypothetical protein
MNRKLVFICVVFIACHIQGKGQGSVNDLESSGSSKLLNDWITVHLRVIRNGSVFNHNHRQSAYVGVALYESIVNGDKKYRSLDGQLNGYKSVGQHVDTSGIFWQASANTALATMFRFFYPEQASKTMFDSTENAWKKHFLEKGINDASIITGSQYGEEVAKSVIEWSKSDGDDKANDEYDIPKGEGLWEPTPPKYPKPITPYQGKERTIVEGSIDNSLPPPPTTFSRDSQSDFYKMVAEVYDISGQLDEGKKEIGLFWDDFPDGKSVTSGGHWASILKTIMEENHISLIEGAHLYAALFISTHDAAIGCFKAKYTYNLLRPVTYIQKYMNHPEWKPMIVTPPHPEYPAAHATVSMAAATILTTILGNNVSFTDNTYRYRGFKSHHFNNLIDAAKEAGLSRFYGGIHYKKSIEAGYTEGKDVAGYIAKKLVFRN